MCARGGGLWRISDLHPAYDPLHFVLFHPHGEPGWQPGMPHAVVAPAQDDGNEEECRNPTLAKCEGEAQHLEKVRSWSPLGLSNVQSSIARPKTPRIGVFLVSLERS